MSLRCESRLFICLFIYFCAPAHLQICMITIIKLKVHILGNKALPLSLSLSHSFSLISLSYFSFSG